MRRLTVLAICVFGTIGVSGASAQNGKYPPLTDYLMSRDAEVALAQKRGPGQHFKSGHDQGADAIRVCHRSPR
jgi:hypothetical protein